MSSHAARMARRRTPARVRRRRLVVLAAAFALAGVLLAAAAGVGPLGEAVREITLPLRHDDIIRQQASEKDLDPTLIAGVIYEESRFRDQTSGAGARGLMQITPETADFIARHSGGNRFEQSDLGTPQINIAYGTYFLRFLIDHYEGDEDVDVPERGDRRRHAVGGRRRVGEVALELPGCAELVRKRRHARGIGAPRLARVVRHEALDEQVGAELAQPPRDRVADPGAATDPGHECPPPCQRVAQSPSSFAYVSRYSPRASSTVCT